MNNQFHPGSRFTPAHQPLLTDEMSQQYSQYVVIGNKCTVRAMPISYELFKITDGNTTLSMIDMPMEMIGYEQAHTGEITGDYPPPRYFDDMVEQGTARSVIAPRNRFTLFNFEYSAEKVYGGDCMGNPNLIGFTERDPTDAIKSYNPLVSTVEKEFYYHLNFRPIIPANLLSSTQFIKLDIFMEYVTIWFNPYPLFRSLANNQARQPNDDYLV